MNFLNRRTTYGDTKTEEVSIIVPTMDLTRVAEHLMGQDERLGGQLEITTWSTQLGRLVVSPTSLSTTVAVRKELWRALKTSRIFA